ncbi:MAG TPA: ABC transporter permease [Puia sp.]|uniref:ABC transporter permease n=1 Tax=Puia sp. TaxID=2045100 RepID=UPI002BD7B291|nr:ABC transporter permease [Puia sp.]HVU97879.1 ABC transporter permease [Puia sp.]
MFKNHLIVAFRALLRDRTHSFIHITGLAIGMAIAMLIGLWIRDELSYEKENPHYQHIARVMQNQTTNGVVSANRSMPLPLASELRTTYGSNFTRVVAGWWTQEYVLASGEKKLRQKGRFMEPGAAEVMGLRFIKGNGGLDDPNSILLSESAAKAMFGDTDPVGKTMSIDVNMVVRVKGVYADVPHHSYFNDVLFVAPFALFANANPWIKEVRNNWTYDFVELFVLLRDGVDVDRLSASLRNSTLDKMKDNPLGAAYHPQVFLHPMSRWHLYSGFGNGVTAGGNTHTTRGNIEFVWLFGTIGFFVLLLACINFMNLATARSERRAREVGIRKAIGGMRGQLMVQFYCESLAMALAAFVVASILVMAALPFFNALADKRITIGWSTPLVWASGLGFTLFTALLAGSYPAIYLSSFRPVAVLKGAFKAGRWAGAPRRVLVSLQFTVSVMLIIGTLVVHRQIQFAKDRPVGYDQGGLLSMSIQTPGFAGHAETVRQELLQTGVVAETAFASSSTSVIWDLWSGYSWRGKNPAVQGDFASIGVSPEYGKTLGWKFVAGRDFSRDLATDSSAAVINEAAVKFTGLKNPIGEQIKRADGRVFTVIGVVHDMVVNSPYDRVQQAIYTYWQDYDRVYFFIRTRPGVALSAALPLIRGAFQRAVPTEPFDYQFPDEEYAKKFAAETRIGTIAAFFAGFALFISALGIFGMASFTAGQRKKEIGVRRVLGGSVGHIWALLSREFLLLTALSFAIGGPLGYYFMHRWLEGYVFHAGIPWWLFAATGIGVLVVTLATVSGQAVRAALMNPSKSLRSE